MEMLSKIGACADSRGGEDVSSTNLFSVFVVGTLVSCLFQVPRKIILPIMLLKMFFFKNCLGSATAPATCNRQRFVFSLCCRYSGVLWMIHSILSCVRL